MSTSERCPGLLPGIAVFLAVGATGFAQSPGGTFAYDFGTDQSADWLAVVESEDGTDSHVLNWTYDYSTHVQASGTQISIPPAPRTGDASTVGVRIEVNVEHEGDVGVITALSLFPTAPGTLSRYRLTFDAWVNYNGDPGQGIGSTEFLTYGAHWDGNGAAWAPPVASTSATGWFAAHSGDGDAAANHRFYTPDDAGIPVRADSSSDTPFGNIVKWFRIGESASGATPPWFDLFPDADPNTGSARLGPYPREGAIGRAWNTWILDVDGAEVTIAVVPAGGTAIIVSRHTSQANVAAAGYPTIGMLDPFRSISPTHDNFVIIDNVTIEPLEIITPVNGFEMLPKVVGTGSGPGGAPASSDFGFFGRTWSERFGGKFGASWLTDAELAAEPGALFDKLIITGQGSANMPGSLAASTAEWICPNSVSGAQLFTAGNVYFLRARVAYETPNDLGDEFRLFLQENTVSSFNQSYLVTAQDPPVVRGEVLDHPFLPPTGTPRDYLTQVDPRDADLAGFNDGNPANDRPFLVGYDLIDVLVGGPVSVSLSRMEIGSADQTAYNSNETLNPGGGSFGGIGGALFSGNDDASYDGWRSITGALVPLSLVGGQATLLTNPVQTSVLDASIDVEHSTGDPINAPQDIEFAEFSNFAGDDDISNGTSDVDVVEVVADAVYRADYDVAGDPGVDDALSPSFRLRVSMPIPTFSIEYQVTASRGTALATPNVADRFPVYFTAPPQFTPSAALLGEENDLQLAFGPFNTEYTDGTLSLKQTRLMLLGANDPNIDY